MIMILILTASQDALGMILILILKVLPLERCSLYLGARGSLYLGARQGCHQSG